MLLRKIITNLPFSPALVNQIGFYAQRLKKEQVTRRLGLLFTALAVLVQSFALFNPPEPALAANQNNVIFNGIHSKSDLLNAWDKNTDGHGHRDIQQIFKYFLGQGFSRSDLAATKKGSFGSRDKVNGGRILSLGRTQQTSDPAQKAHIIRGEGGQKSTIWSRHLDAFDTGANRSGRGSIYQAYIGSYQGKWFAIILNCGNLVFSDTIKVPTITPVLTVKADCRTITGYAYDRSNLKAALKTYLYLDGGPGKGEKFSATANLSTPDDNVTGAHGFSYTIPTKYHTGKTYAYTLIATPAYPENQTVQRSGAIDTSTCKPPEPVATCDSLQLTLQPKTRDQYTFTANASVVNGANIKGYRYIVKDASGKTIDVKEYTTDKGSQTSEVITLSQAGNYTVSAVALTSIGQKTSDNCTKSLSIQPPEKCVLNPELLSTDTECKPCPGDGSVWYKDERCNPEIIKSKSVENLTQNLPSAAGTTAQPGDRLRYTLFVENTGLKSETLTLTEDLSDVLEYADLSGFGDEKTASFNKATGTLTWEGINLAPGEKITKRITVEMKDTIPATPKSAGNPESYDCQMGNVFGGASVVVKVACPTTKVVENTVESLPQTGTGSNIIFSVALITIFTYFYARVRQMNKELRLIRKEFNTGAM